MGRTIKHPTAVVRTRQEPFHIPAHFPVGSELDTVPVRRELAPEPVQQSAYDTVGRAMPPRIFRPANTLSMPEWLGVMAWPFQLPRMVTPIRVGAAPHQGMVPVGERVNIEGSRQVTLGSTATLKGAPMWAPQYAKLGVWT